MEFLAARAREKGVPIGFDCSHSAGAVPRELDRWGVDFAMWCGFGCLNGGPGTAAFLYVNRRHFGEEPALAGSFGSAKDKQFDMSLDFEPRRRGPLADIVPGHPQRPPLIGSLGIFEEAGMAAVREKSLRMTRFLMEMADALLAAALRLLDRHAATGRPPRRPRRPGPPGSHAHRQALRVRGVVPDFRPPDIVRVAPVALYNTFGELVSLVGHLRESSNGGIRALPADRKAIYLTTIGPRVKKLG